MSQVKMAKFSGISLDFHYKECTQVAREKTIIMIDEKTA